VGLNILRGMEIKPKPNRQRYLDVLRRMTPEERLAKAMELSELGKELFLSGLRQRFPAMSETEIRALYLRRMTRCHNRNY
jgi:hypothetical protein